jgi:hypothetical protein
VRTYKVLLPLTVHTTDGAYTQGETFQADFTWEQEAENLDSGLLEVQPSEYEVLAGRVFETEAGETFTAALRLGNEQQLVEGGVIKPVEPPPAKPSRKKKEAN